MAEAILQILAYLHRLNPPVVHRDLKPANLILDPDGCPHLVDFGAVQAISRAQGLTVVGTFGYMAPEQFAGRALPASDLYALGATLAQVMTGLAPQELLAEGAQTGLEASLDFRPHFHGSQAFAAWIARLLEPLPARRFGSAREALSALWALEGQGTGPLPTAASPPAVGLAPAPPTAKPMTRLERSPGRLVLIVALLALPISLLVAWMISDEWKHYRLSFETEDFYVDELFGKWRIKRQKHFHVENITSLRRTGEHLQLKVQLYDYMLGPNLSEKEKTWLLQELCGFLGRDNEEGRQKTKQGQKPEGSPGGEPGGERVAGKGKQAGQDEPGGRGATEAGEILSDPG